MTEAPPQVPKRRLLPLIGRALTLRCPNCGARGILRGWFKLRDRCPSCGLALERGEQHDYWLGAYMLNLVAAELIAAALIVGYILATRPEVRWDELQYVAIAAVLVMPVLFFPFSRTLWLAADLYIRPVEQGDRAP